MKIKWSFTYPCKTDDGKKADLWSNHDEGRIMFKTECWLLGFDPIYTGKN